eukprot:TRINITY_DN1_c3_g1_i2.p1 TRINITY_DN1_c3_g1~~TRINITY_DN1_c3_g1_i2.p1  ORF type:complete len:253 (+),score=-59.48 TRINITY_DN1_c3_g1_i2:197-955(+)
MMQYNALKQTCLREGPQAPVAFKNLMTRGILQFALHIAFCCVLHRYGSLDIHRQKFIFLILQIFTKLSRITIFFQHKLKSKCNIFNKFFTLIKNITKQYIQLGLDFVLMILPQVHLRKPCYDFSFLQVIMVYLTSQVSHKDLPSPEGSPNHSIGRSDGRCVQRAGTQSRCGDDAPILGNPSSCPIIAKDSSHYDTDQKDYPNLCRGRKYLLTVSLQRACGPGRLGASQTCYRLKLPCVCTHSPSKKDTRLNI